MSTSVNHLATIAVTGGGGRLGSAVIRELLKHGYRVKSLDIRAQEGVPYPSVAIDLNRFEDVAEALRGCDSVIHVAAYPDPHYKPAHITFSNNVVSTFNILEAAAELGMKKAVLASSEASYGIPWAVHPYSPDYVPIDEEHPQQPQECYGLSKVVNEQTAEMFNRRTGMQVTSLRLASILSPEDMEPFVRMVNEDLGKWKRILWSFIDVRDAASACRLAYEADGLGAEHFNIAADDTCSAVETAELLRAYYPDVADVRAPFNGFGALYSNAKAKRLLGWKPVHSWREATE